MNAQKYFQTKLQCLVTAVPVKQFSFSHQRVKKLHDSATCHTPYPASKTRSETKPQYVIILDSIDIIKKFRACKLNVRQDDIMYACAARCLSQN